MKKTLIERLFDSDSASALTNEAARRILELEDAIMSMIYYDRGAWKVGVKGDYEAPEEVQKAITKPNE